MTLAQGASSNPVNVTVTAQNGFSGSVQVSLSGLPSGVTSNPSSPFSVAAGASTTVVFGAASNATTGAFTVSAQGESSTLSHSASLSLTIQKSAPVSINLPRTSYTRTDATAAMDTPPGEAPHRHLVYDSAHKQLFVANCAMNRVEVFSTVTQTRLAQISVPGASSVDLSSDATTLWVGTITEQAVAIDTVSLQIKSRYPIAGLGSIPGVLFDRPEELLTLSNGNAFMRLRQSAQSEALLAFWNPTANTLTDLTPVEPELFQNGVGAIARTGDHTKVLIASSDASGEVAVFDSTGTAILGPRGLGNGDIPFVAANPDGSRFAVVSISNGVSQLFLLDGSLYPVGNPAAIDVSGLAFSGDGNFLYVTRPASTIPVIMVLDGHDLSTIGVVPDAAIEGISSRIEDVDETQLIFGLANRGVSFVDAATPQNLPGPAPFFATAPISQPSEGPNIGGTSATFLGQNFTPLAQVNFGQQAATNFSLASGTQIQATSPASGVNGAINATAYFSDGWLAIAPDAFSYGPEVLQILPNAGVKQGGDTIQIYGYGFGSDPTKLAVQIGGVSATVQTLENVSQIAPSLQLDSSFPFPLECITLQTPPGTPGKADIVISSPTGTITSAKSFQFLQSVQSFAKPGYYRFVLYDQQRQWLYLTNIDHVDIFDIAAQTFRSPLMPPPNGPPPNAALRGLSLTPDSSQLVVADFGAQNIYLIQPDNGTGSAVAVGGVPGFLNSGPSRVAATSAQTVFVALSGEGGGTTQVCSNCLGQLDLTASPITVQPAPQPEVTSSTLTGSPLIQGNAAGDHVFLAFGAAPGGPVAAWDATSPNQFQTIAASSSAVDLGAAADGTLFALQANNTTEIRDSQLFLDAVATSGELTQIPGATLVPGVMMHPSGALIYKPFLTGAPASTNVYGGIDILDAHSGVLRLRIFLPQQLLTDVDALHGSFLAIDETGQRLFALTSADGSAQKAGVTTIQLAAVPLGIGTISPQNASASGGTALTIRGSGFQSGVTVSIGGKAATVTVKDISTLSVTTPALSTGPQQITITNPDGETVSLDAAITAN